MIDLNALTVNAANTPSGIATSEAPGTSTDFSAPTAQDFSAILTEMTGAVSLSSGADLTIVAGADSTNSLSATAPGANAQPSQQIGAPAELTQTQLPPPVPNAAQLATPQPDGKQISAVQQTTKSQGPQQSKDPRKTQDQDLQANLLQVAPLAAVWVAPSILSGQKAVATRDGKAQQPPINLDPLDALAPTATSGVLPPEMQQAWADVKKFEFTVQNETVQPANAGVQPQVAPADVQKQAIVTTDPIANIQLQQLPPRITAVEKLTSEMRLPDRTKPDAAQESADISTTSPTMHFADVGRSVEQVEQARPAHPVEIPEMPHVQVVRSVAMEVGDPGSQVTVHIQERAGDISLQINAANEPLHQELQSSVGSLVQALKQEQVQVSNIEVSRKSPIDKVRRMKEAN